MMYEMPFIIEWMELFLIVGILLYVVFIFGVVIPKKPNQLALVLSLVLISLLLAIGLLGPLYGPQIILF